MKSNHQNSSRGRSIGAILVDNGILSTADAEQVLIEQKKSNLRFGDAAIRLGLLTTQDIQFALAHQFNYPYLAKGNASISEEITAAFNPFSPVVEQLRALRTQLMLRWFDTDAMRKSLAIVSLDSGEGRSYIASNLAVVFSQLGERTLLIDADLRNPCQHKLFKVSNGSGLSSVLSGRATPHDVVIKVESMRGLSLLPAGATPPNPQELLGREIFQGMLAQAAKAFDVIIIDTAAASLSADAQMIAARAGASLLVARNNLTPAAELQNLATNLQNSNVTIVGSLLNDF